MTPQEGKHAAARTYSGTTGTYNEDLLAAYNKELGTTGPLPAQEMLWLESKTSLTGLTLSEQRHAYADAQGFDTWEAVDTLAFV